VKIEVSMQHPLVSMNSTINISSAFFVHFDHQTLCFFNFILQNANIMVSFVCTSFNLDYLSFSEFPKILQIKGVLILQNQDLNRVENRN
jgi:hypothetical protein